MRILRNKIRIPVDTKKTISKVFGWVINAIVRKLAPIIPYALALIIWNFKCMDVLSYFDRTMIETRWSRQCQNTTGSFECRNVLTSVSRQRSYVILLDDKDAGRKKRADCQITIET